MTLSNLHIALLWVRRKVLMDYVKLEANGRPHLWKNLGVLVNVEDESLSLILHRHLIEQ